MVDLAPRTLSFTVHGTPAPQGSKTNTPWGGMREANPATMPWRQAVAHAALAARRTAPMLTGPVAIHADFSFRRPKHHYRSGRFAGMLKPGAPVYCETPPDADKLARAIGDALSGVLFRDDSQVVCWMITKRYGVPCAEITVAEIEAEAA